MNVRKIERINPQNRSEKRWYIAKAPSKSIELKHLAQEIEKRSTVSRADVMAVLTSLVDLVPQHLSKGYSVQLGELGSLRINISSASAPTFEQINASMVKGFKISFLAGKEIKKQMMDMKYKVI
jgi:predicted histone-like DNA-binding protein